MRNGMIVAVPNPSPMSGGAEIDAAILNALEEADKKGLKGRDITPFVLASVNDATAGQSLKSNVALVRKSGVGRTDFKHESVSDHSGVKDVRAAVLSLREILREDT